MAKTKRSKTKRNGSGTKIKKPRRKPKMRASTK